MNYFVTTNSSMILAIGFDADAGELQVVFITLPQVVYIYQGVSRDVYIRLMTARSVGEYFASVIKSDTRSYPFKKEPLSVELRKALRL